MDLSPGCPPTTEIILPTDLSRHCSSLLPGQRVSEHKQQPIREQRQTETPQGSCDLSRSHRMMPQQPDGQHPPAGRDSLSLTHTHRGDDIITGRHKSERPA